MLLNVKLKCHTIYDIYSSRTYSHFIALCITLRIIWLCMGSKQDINRYIINRRFLCNFRSEPQASLDVVCSRHVAEASLPYHASSAEIPGRQLGQPKLSIFAQYVFFAHTVSRPAIAVQICYVLYIALVSLIEIDHIG